jgi:putative hemolysin
MRIGKVVEQELLSAMCSDKTRTAYIRARCYTLGRPGARDASKRKRLVPIATQQSREGLLDEIRSLPPQRILAEDNKFQTLCVDGKESPLIMREIGRLREKAFRAVKEGSGKAVDVDCFDPHYIHLILWDKETESIAGGYRARFLFPPASLKTVRTLYTYSLFRYKKEFFEHCGASMELGRAFVTPEYQRNYAPLLMLWKGICHLAAISGTRTLFGASSIGLGYAPESVHMLRQHLEEHYAAPHLAPLVRGRRKPRPFSGSNTPDARGLEYKVLDRAVKGLEGDKGLPILFKHYLQMEGRIAAFHEDREFGTLDALMVVDLAKAPEKLLLRYMGKERLRLLRRAHSMQRDYSALH